MSRILVIGDVHEPASHPGYQAFCQDVADKHRCTRVVFIGDMVDWHAISFHAANPEASGPKDEYELAHARIATWYSLFPRATVCIGNHDERVIRRASTVNIPARLLRPYADIWSTPNWNWTTDAIIDDVYYFHGTGTSGAHPAYSSMVKRLMSVVQGHIHSAGGIKWRASPQRRTFAMDTGCGVDDKAIAFAYGRACPTRSILSAGVILNGLPYHEVMPIGRKERYHKSRFIGRR